MVEVETVNSLGSLKQGSLWTELITYKYIWPIPLLDWFRLRSWNGKNISEIWRVVLNTLHTIRRGLTWRIGNGEEARIGLDPWISCGNTHLLPQSLIDFLNQKDIFLIAHIGDSQNTNVFQQAWLSGNTLGIPDRWLQEWDRYIRPLTESHVRLREELDELLWGLAQNGKYSPKEGYLVIHSRYKPEICQFWWKNIWKLWGPPRSRLLMWNIIEDKVLTGTNLRKRAFLGPTWRVLCKQEEESTKHLFLAFPKTQIV